MAKSNTPRAALGMVVRLRRGAADSSGVAASNRGALGPGPVGHGAPLWRGATAVPPRAANPGAARGGLATDKWPPHVSEFQISEKKTRKFPPSQEKLDTR
jgi:hypothetical protein